MAQDVIITPANGEIQWQDNASGVAFADIDANNNLSITNPGGNLSIGDGSSDVYIGNGVANVDLVFEQDGEIRGTGSQTLTLGTSGDTIEVAGGTTFSVQTDLSFAANPEITWTSNFLDLYSTNAIGVVRILGNASYAPRFEIYTDAGTTRRIMLDPGSTSYFDGTNAQLGIGTTSPSTTFSVQNTLTYNASTRLLEVINSGNAGGLNISGANGRIYMSGTRALEGSGSTTLTVGEGFTAVSMLKSVYMASASGSVGIGTASPSYRLHVIGGGARIEDGETTLSPDSSSSTGTSSRALSILNLVDTAWTTDALTAYNATTSYDILNRASYSFFARPKSTNIFTHCTEVNDNAHLYRFVNLNSAATEPLLRWYFYQYDGSGTTTSDFQVPAKLFEITGLGGTKLMIHGDGNVGIGTDSSSAKLQVLQENQKFSLLIGADSGADSITNATNKFSRLGMPHYTNAEEPLTLLTGSSQASVSTLYLGGGTGYGNAVTSIQFLTGANTTTTNGTLRMILDSGGNLGIGTAIPANPLDVLGKVSINTDGTLNWGNAKDYGRLTWDTGKAIVRGESGKALSLGSNGTQDYIFIDTSGNVGIGYITPASKLDVRSTTAYTLGVAYIEQGVATNSPTLQVLQSISGGNANVDQGLVVKVVGTSNGSGNSFHVYRNDNTSTGLIVKGSGSVGVGTSTPSNLFHVVGGSTLQGTVNLVNNNLSNVGHITINDPGVGEGLAWNSTSGNWIIDVAPLGRTNADGNLNFYNSSSNNIALWRPQLWVYDASNYATGTANSDGSLTITSTNTGNTIFNIDGSNGTLFEVVDDLSGSLMSVNDAAGLPVLEVFADSHIVAGRYGQNDFYLDTNGNLGLGTDSPLAKLQVLQENQKFSLLIGADAGASSLTNTTNKYSRFGMPHYTNAEEPVTLIYGTSQSSISTLYLGGGTTYGNAVTNIQFRVAANTTTTSGDTKMLLDSNGNLGLNTVLPGARLHVYGGTTAFTNMSDNNDSVQITRNASVHTHQDAKLFIYDPSNADWAQKISLAGYSYGLRIDGWVDYGLYVTHNTLGDVLVTRSTELVINESSNDYNFRVEGQTDTSLLVCDASTDRVGIGFSSPSYKLDVNGDAFATTLLSDYRRLRSYGNFSTSTNNTAGWYPLAAWGTSSGNRGGFIFYVSYTGGNHNPVTYVIKAFKNWSNDGALIVEKYGSNSLITDARIIADSSTVYHLELYLITQSTGHSFEVRYEALGYDSSGSSIVNFASTSLALSTNTGSVIASMNFGAGEGIAVHNALVQSNLHLGSAMYHHGDTDTYLGFNTNEAFLVAGSVNALHLYSTEAVVNENGANFNFRVEGDTDANLIKTDASNDRVGIGTSSPSEKLEVAGNIIAKDKGVLAGVNGNKDGFIFHDLATGGGNYWGYKGFTSPSRLSIVTDGSERLTVDTNGNVGIGTTSPSFSAVSGNTAKGLEIANSGNDTQASLRLTGHNNTGTPGQATYTELKHAGANLRFDIDHNGTTALSINSSGNLGIGTTDPYAKLQVNGSTQTFNAHFGQGQNNGNGNWGGISLGYTENNNNYRKVGIVAKAIGDNAARQELHFLVDSANDSANATLTDSKMMIDINGNVGIGTTSPSYELEVSTSSNSRITASNTTYSVVNHLQADNTGGWVGPVSNHPLMIKTNNTERVRVTSSGSVGVGLTTPLTNSLMTVNGGFAVGDASYLSNLNNGTADFSVDCNGTPMISWVSNYLQIGGTNQNWNMKMYNGLLQTYSSNLSIIAGGTGTYRLYLGTSNNTTTATVYNSNFGLGTTTPTEKLHVVGNIALSSTSYKIGYRDSTAMDVYIQFDDNNPSYSIAGTTHTTGGGLKVVADKSSAADGNSFVTTEVLDAHGITAQDGEFSDDLKVSSSIGVGGSVTTSRVVTITNISSTERPAIKIVNPNFSSDTSSSGKSFYRWLPIDIDGTTRWIAIYQ